MYSINQFAMDKTTEEGKVASMRAFNSDNCASESTLSSAQPITVDNFIIALLFCVEPFVDCNYLRRAEDCTPRELLNYKLHCNWQRK